MITLQERSSLSIYEQIVEQMKSLIARGAIHPGEKIPSVRELSAMLLINPNTVSKAYQELERQGVIQTVRGKGTFASTHNIPRMAEERHVQLKEQLRRLAVEAKHLGMEHKRTLTTYNRRMSTYKAKRLTVA